MTLASWARRLHRCQGLLLDSIPALILLPLAREHSHWAMRTQWYHSAVMDTAVVKRDMNTTEKERGEMKIWRVKRELREQLRSRIVSYIMERGKGKKIKTKSKIWREQNITEILLFVASLTLHEREDKEKTNPFTVTPKDTAGIFLYSMAHWCLPCDIYCTMFYVQVEKDGLWLH